MAENVEFRHLDLREEWNFNQNSFDLITCSLALEHIENLDFVFEQAHKVLRRDGHFYIGELHPFKQYQEAKPGLKLMAKTLNSNVLCITFPNFFVVAKKNNFELTDLKEWFDDDDKMTVPRLLTMIFKTKKSS